MDARIARIGLGFAILLTTSMAIAETTRSTTVPARSEKHVLDREFDEIVSLLAKGDGTSCGKASKLMASRAKWLTITSAQRARIIETLLATLERRGDGAKGSALDSSVRGLVKFIYDQDIRDRRIAARLTVLLSRLSYIHHSHGFCEGALENMGQVGSLGILDALRTEDAPVAPVMNVLREMPSLPPDFLAILVSQRAKGAVGSERFPKVSPVTPGLVAKCGKTALTMAIRRIRGGDSDIAFWIRVVGHFKEDALPVVSILRPYLSYKFREKEDLQGAALDAISRIGPRSGCQDDLMVLLAIEPDVRVLKALGHVGLRDYTRETLKDVWSYGNRSLRFRYAVLRTLADLGPEACKASEFIMAWVDEAKCASQPAQRSRDTLIALTQAYQTLGAIGRADNQALVTFLESMAKENNRFLSPEAAYALEEIRKRQVRSLIAD